MTKTPKIRFSAAKVITAAALAASGATAAEIAAELKTTTTMVFRLLRLHGLRLLPRTPDQVAVPLVVSKQAMAEIERICAPYGADPQAMAGRVLEHLAGDSVRLRELAKEIAEDSAKPRAPRRRSAKSAMPEAAE